MNNDIITNININYVWTSATDVGTGITNYRLQITNTTTNWSTNILLTGLTGTNTIVSNHNEGIYNVILADPPWQYYFSN